MKTCIKFNFYMICKRKIECLIENQEMETSLKLYYWFIKEAFLKKKYWKLIIFFSPFVVSIISFNFSLYNKTQTFLYNYENKIFFSMKKKMFSFFISLCKLKLLLPVMHENYVFFFFKYWKKILKKIHNHNGTSIWILLIELHWIVGAFHHKHNILN